MGVAAKTTEDTSSGVKAKYKLEGTIESVVREIEVCHCMRWRYNGPSTYYFLQSFGGLALPLPWDAITSTSESVTQLLKKISTHFAAPKFYPFGIVYNAGALSWLSLPDTPLKKFDL